MLRIGARSRPHLRGGGTYNPTQFSAVNPVLKLGDAKVRMTKQTSLTKRQSEAYSMITQWLEHPPPRSLDIGATIPDSGS